MTTRSRDLVERSARAIRRICANRSGRGLPWEDLPRRVREDYRREAVAALTAAGVLDADIDQSPPERWGSGDG